MKLSYRKQSKDQPVRRRSKVEQAETRPSQSDLADRYSFRRNRTLTGSSSPNVSSSNELNAELRSPRAHAHHLTSLRRRLMVGIVAVLLLAGALYFIVAQLVATVNIQVADVGVITKDDQISYQSVFQSYYEARPIERLRFMLNEDELLSHVQSNRPEVETISVNPGAMFGEASVAVTARKPIARWELNGKNQFVDGQGTVFSRNYHANPQLQIIDNSGLVSESDRLVASDRFLGFIGRIVAGAKRYDLTVSTVTIPELTTRQVAMTIGSEKTQYLLSVDELAGDQLENIDRIHRYMNKRDRQPRYIDVRVAGKAYYR